MAEDSRAHASEPKQTWQQRAVVLDLDYSPVKIQIATYRPLAHQLAHQLAHLLPSIATGALVQKQNTQESRFGRTRTNCRF